MARARKTPDSRMAGMATSAPTGSAIEAGQRQRSQPGDVVAAGEVAERGRPDGGEGQVAQRDLTRGLHQEAQRQEQHDVDECGRPGGEVDADEAGNEGRRR